MDDTVLKIEELYTHIKRTQVEVTTVTDQCSQLAQNNHTSARNRLEFYELKKDSDIAYRVLEGIGERLRLILQEEYVRRIPE